MGWRYPQGGQVQSQPRGHYVACAWLCGMQSRESVCKMGGVHCARGQQQVGKAARTHTHTHLSHDPLIRAKCRTETSRLWELGSLSQREELDSAGIRAGQSLGTAA